RPATHGLRPARGGAGTLRGRLARRGAGRAGGITARPARRKGGGSGLGGPRGRAPKAPEGGGGAPGGGATAPAPPPLRRGARGGGGGGGGGLLGAEYRRGAGREPDLVVDDYLRRFPEHVGELAGRLRATPAAPAPVKASGGDGEAPPTEIGPVTAVAPTAAL